MINCCQKLMEIVEFWNEKSWGALADFCGKDYDKKKAGDLLEFIERRMADDKREGRVDLGGNV